MWREPAALEMPGWDDACLRAGYGSTVSTRGVPVGPLPDDADPVQYERLRRRVLWKLPMGLYVLGSRSGEVANLMTLNWVMQVAVDPKLLAVSLERSALTHGLVRDGGCFCVSLVARDNKEVVRKFVKPAVHDPEARTLAGFSYRDARSGAPIPEFAIGFLDCTVRHSFEMGSHTLFVGEVIDAGFASGGEEAAVLRMEDTRMSYGG
jgi:flavin reductase (DIM6/NTAB) family NADH-FMN oxidoreductase RutF